MAETAFAPLGRVQCIDLDPSRPNDRRHDELRNSVTPLDSKCFASRVHQDHLDLATVVGIDGSRTVGDEYAMAEG